MRRPLVMGNWKMNGSLVANQALLDALAPVATECSGIDIAVCPSHIYLPQVSSICEGSAIQVGAQNMCDQDKGAFTGEVSAEMLRDFDINYVLVGHSERRAIYGETDVQVAAKVEKALQKGLVPVLCVGETLEERKSGDMQQVIETQIRAVLQHSTIKAFAQLVVAYEPVWAIGTGETATPEQAQEVHAFIRDLLAQESAEIAARTTILYGGSVSAANADALFAMPDVDGGLVGGASLKAGDFAAICRAAQGSL
ncbi:MAG: triose-phosphate isomerase [Oceanospirillaceae bacterium]|nr:triose-phosphate isomerase [Oceanospirillaceae bacterium]